MLREVRRWVTGRISDAALACAPHLRAGAIDGLEHMLARFGPAFPVLSDIVEQNMRAVGVYSPEAHREYFARASAHLAGLMHLFRHARDATGGMPAELEELVRRRIQIDDSFDRLREAAAAGKGVIILGVHAADFLFVLSRTNQELPITVYLRFRKEADRRKAQERWCRVTGLDHITEPASLTDPTRRVALMAEALAQGRVLIITPDLVQKRGQGVAVRFFDRQIELPRGPAGLSLVTGAPLMTMLARASLGGTCLTVHGPMAADAVRRGRGWRQAAIQERMQWFTDLFTSRFLVPHPALWFLWADKRWTRAFRGDPKYVAHCERRPARADSRPGTFSELM